ncbi:hypothetical protein B4Q04_10970 [Zobellia sp. OII3]|nr:hypothetical protein B4Q04_10970 [Zobellia sp. OII3]
MKAAQLFITSRVFNERFPFRKYKNIEDLLISCNTTIKFKNGLMKWFSQSDSKRINKMVVDRIINLKSK